jgi:hypothetical protein
MKARRGPWLSGLVLALVFTVWMIGQVIGGVITMVGHVLSTDPAGPPTGAGTAQFTGSSLP